MGGFPELVEGEDFAAGQLLAAAAGHACLADPEALVLTADRVRETGFESTARAGMKNSGLAATGPPCDNPLFQLAVQTARGGLSLPDALHEALENSFGVTLPRPGEALPAITPLVADPVAQESLLTRLLALFHPGAEARLTALQAAVGERCLLPCGDAAERHLYLRLAAIMPVVELKSNPCRTETSRTPCESQPCSRLTPSTIDPASLVTSATTIVFTRP